MSCYLKHIQDVLDEAGIAVTPANRQLVDEAVHKTVGTRYKDCPAAWKKLKEDVLSSPDKRREFIKRLARELK